MTDTMKIGLILGGVALLGIGVAVVATRPPAQPESTFTDTTPPPAPTEEGGSTAARNVRSIATAATGIGTAIIQLVDRREEREAAERRRQEDREDRRGDVAWCRANPNASICGPVRPNASSGPSSPNSSGPGWSMANPFA